jgi:hypothetical protein
VAFLFLPRANDGALGKCYSRLGNIRSQRQAKKPNEINASWENPFSPNNFAFPSFPCEPQEMAPEIPIAQAGKYLRYDVYFDRRAVFGGRRFKNKGQYWGRFETVGF